jgi:hypothetical protein
MMLLASRDTPLGHPHGWPMKGGTPAEAAAQDTYDEAGLIGHIVGKRPNAKSRSSTHCSIACSITVSPSVSMGRPCAAGSAGDAAGQSDTPRQR